MKRTPTRYPVTISTVLKVGLYLVSSLFVLGVFLFTNGMVSRLSGEITTTSRVLAQFCAEASFPAVREPELQAILTEVISNIDFPLVITDVNGTPRAWRGVGVDPELVPATSIDSVAAGRGVSPVISARLEAVRAQVKRLDAQNPPIVMTQSDPPDTLGAVHFGDPVVLDRLRWMPYISVAGVIMVISIGFWGLATIRQAERRSIWVGMAKETAHQLGTPLSSLMGWIELLRSQADSTGGQEVHMPRTEMDETLTEMEYDVERLNKVAQRFSNVGSAPILQLQSLHPVVREAVLYVRRRLPANGVGIELRERYEEVPPVNLNRELVEWALENILINAVSALDKRPGLIEVIVERRKETEAVEVVVTDNGRGMSQAEQRRAFDPGYTTKRRGWGLGLALARRVVQEYHGGQIRIRHSAPGEGTTIVLTFPT